MVTILRGTQFPQIERREMKIVTYNVNGLRPRIAQYGSLLKLLNSLQADIICFQKFADYERKIIPLIGRLDNQETKLWKAEMTADVIMAEGYETFFSCTCTSGQGRTGYSGVATFCRVKTAFSSSEVALPLIAEEGFTGLLEHSQTVNLKRKDTLLELPTKVEGLEEITKEDLLKLDSEGRCIVTDHGHFVLFNIYGPRAGCDDTERIDFKLKFYQALQKRWESFLSQGKRVFVVGDLNIAPSAVDRCEAGPDFENNQFRKWMRSLLVEHGGPFVDCFRAKHPQRREAYTCWPINTGGEEFNYGSRIDHILFAGPCLHPSDDMEGHNFVDCCVDECDIMTQFKRWKPENTPRWKGGRKVKLEGSDHAPVYVSLAEMPNLPQHNTPSLSARYVPKVHGCQQTIVSLLSKRQLTSSRSDAPSAESLLVAVEENRDVSSSGVTQEAADDNSLFLFRNEARETKPTQCTTANKKVKHSNSAQRTIGSYFQKKPDTDEASANGPSSQEEIKKQEAAFSRSIQGLNSPEGLSTGNEVNANCQENDYKMSPPTMDTSDTQAFCSGKEKNSAALLEWQRIQQLMLKRNNVPLCRHGEPCVSRLVKKEGPNLGRKFYVCNRSEGPSSNPEARCRYFKWAISESARKGGLHPIQKQIAISSNGRLPNLCRRSTDDILRKAPIFRCGLKLLRYIMEKALALKKGCAGVS